MESKHIALIAFMAISAGFGIIMMLIHAWGQRRRPPRPLVDTHRIDALEQRLVRIEAAVDTVAVEIERISEAQRFQTRLLSERLDTPARIRSQGPTG